MGLFSSKKVIYVSSVAYNMAGPITDRMSVLKSTVARHVLQGDKKVGLGERIIKTQMSGPTMSQRNWFRWTKNNYLLGRTDSRVANRSQVDDAVVLAYLTVPVGHEALIDDAFVSPADVMFWAEEHILATNPSLIDTDWVADLTIETNTIRIQYEDLSYEDVVISNYLQNGNYIICYYRTKEIGAAEETAVRRVFIYRIGTGNLVLDALFVAEAPTQEFFPPIPLRIDNRPIDHEDFEEHFEIIAKAYKKATGEKIDKILESIEDNENVDDIDYATLVFGVEITTEEKCGLRYLYEFFKGLIPRQIVSAAAFEAWYGGLPTPGIASPSLSYRKLPGTSSLRVNCADDFMSHFDYRLNWITIKESLQTGLGKPDAERGDIWFEDQPAIAVDGPTIKTSADDYSQMPGSSIPYSRLIYQDKADSYRVLDIFGMVHENYVYGGKNVNLTTSAALSGDDEEGFIVPLHYPTLTKLPLVMANQLAISSRQIVFNCYQVVKIRWYQRGIFKILISIVISIITAFIFPGAVGLLGTALQVGSYLGFSGISAVIVGAAVNALAAIVLTMIIEKASIAIFGEGLGRLLSSILSFFAFQMVSNMAAGLGATIDWGSLMRMDRLMGLLNSAVEGVGGWIQGEIANIQSDMEKEQKKFKNDWEDLQKQAFDLLGAGGGVIDPLMFTQAQSPYLRRESRDAFLQRTLMTGSDLIDLNLSMIEDFVDLTLTIDTENI